jgi:prepilin-type N-terminal cleavage/methylation domain-containing protein
VHFHNFHKRSLRASTGFTMVECVVAIAVLGIGVASTIGGLTRMNSLAASARNTTGAYQVLENQVDLVQSISPFNPQKTTSLIADPCSGSIPAAQIPTDACHGSYPMYDMTTTAAGTWRSISVDGTTFSVPVYQYTDPTSGTVVVVQGQVQVQVTDLNFAGTTPSSGPYQALFRVTYTYRGKNYSYSMSTMRSSDI